LFFACMSSTCDFFVCFCQHCHSFSCIPPLHLPCANVKFNNFESGFTCFDYKVLNYNYKVLPMLLILIFLCFLIIITIISFLIFFLFLLLKFWCWFFFFLCCWILPFSYFLYLFIHLLHFFIEYLFYKKSCVKVVAKHFFCIFWIFILHCICIMTNKEGRNEWRSLYSLNLFANVVILIFKD